jgi:zinc transport system substrate-binding protein
VPFEAAWLDKIAVANPDMRVVRTDAGIEKIPMSAHSDHEGHDGDGDRHENGHDHGTRDPHIWLSPPLVKIQAGHILDALTAADPAHEAFYRANHAAFERDLEALDAELREVFAGKGGKEFMVFHPSWGYFARAYGLRQVPVEIEGKDPKPAQLQALIRHTRERGIRTVFVQPQFSTRSAGVIAEAIDGEVVVADPLAEEWAENLRRQAEAIAGAVR